MSKLVMDKDKFMEAYNDRKALYEEFSEMYALGQIMPNNVRTAHAIFANLDYVLSICEEVD